MKGLLATFFLIGISSLSFFLTFHEQVNLKYCYLFYGLFILDYFLVTAFFFTNPGVYNNTKKTKKNSDPPHKHDTSIIYESLEKNYCQVCLLNQPIRTKHCKICETCILTYDHHCFWLGNCVGEKNRLFFYISLLMYSIQSLLLLIFNSLCL